jgi:hypothetical protein
MHKGPRKELICSDVGVGMVTILLPSSTLVYSRKFERKERMTQSLDTVPLDILKEIIDHWVSSTCQKGSFHFKSTNSLVYGTQICKQLHPIFKAAMWKSPEFDGRYIHHLKEQAKDYGAHVRNLRMKNLEQAGIIPLAQLVNLMKGLTTLDLESWEDVDDLDGPRFRFRKSLKSGVFPENSIKCLTLNLPTIDRPELLLVSQTLPRLEALHILNYAAVRFDVKYKIARIFLPELKELTLEEAFCVTEDPNIFDIPHIRQIKMALEEKDSMHEETPRFISFKSFLQSIHATLEALDISAGDSYIDKQIHWTWKMLRWCPKLVELGLDLYKTPVPDKTLPKCTVNTLNIRGSYWYDSGLSSKLLPYVDVFPCLTAIYIETTHSKDELVELEKAFGNNVTIVR